MTDTFVPYRDRPALDKGASIPWTDLESGMLFEPLAGAPSTRRVRGVPQFIWHGEFRTPSYMIGSEDATDGRPCGGVIGDGNELYVRHYDDDGRAVYRSSSEIVRGCPASEQIVGALRPLFEAKVAELLASPVDGHSYERRLRVARQNLTVLDER